MVSGFPLLCDIIEVYQETEFAPEPDQRCRITNDGGRFA